MCRVPLDHRGRHHRRTVDVCDHFVVTTRRRRPIERVSLPQRRPPVALAGGLEVGGVERGEHVGTDSLGVDPDECDRCRSRATYGPTYTEPSRSGSSNCSLASPPASPVRRHTSYSAGRSAIVAGRISIPTGSHRRSRDARVDARRRHPSRPGREDRIPSHAMSTAERPAVGVDAGQSTIRVQVAGEQTIRTTDGLGHLSSTAEFVDRLGRRARRPRRRRAARGRHDHPARRRRRPHRHRRRDPLPCRR